MNTLKSRGFMPLGSTWQEMFRNGHGLWDGVWQVCCLELGKRENYGKLISLETV